MAKYSQASDSIENLVTEISNELGLANYGVDFQEYLRHELSDSSVFVFLNTPNYPMSQFTMEELTVCSKLQMGILEIKTPNSSNYEEAKFSRL